ncbi:MAG: CoB--CoM heterodisulfide reductase iron-sulfur subunit B family protein [Thermoguttaceae bacterium]|jgi:heterodisulfide reductase subunit B
MTTTPDIPPVKKGVLLFRSCLVSSEYPGAEAATKWLFEKFDIEYTVHPEQTCCTGLGYYSELVPVATTVALAARNACVAVDDGHPVMSYLCSTCYAINKKARNILDIPRFRDEANAALAKIGRKYDDTVARTVRHSHTMEILWSVHHSIPKLIQRLLTGIKVATHPACHYCKVFPEEVVGNSENFMIPEELLESTGAIPTGLYNEKSLHCGAGFRQRFVNPSMAVAVTREKLRRLAQEKVDVCVHMCPNCAIQFDRHHEIISRASGESFPFIHLHIQQLLALALGADPEKDCGLQSHSQDVTPFLEKIGVR